MKRILVATDGSLYGDRAVDLAAALAKSSAAELVIMTVVERVPPEVAEAYEQIEHVAPGDVADISAHSLLYAAQERARRAGATKTKVLAETGDPTEAIIETAKRNSIDAIVVGRRGRGRLAGLLLGSVSQKLVSLAPCAVVVVPG